MLIYTKSPPGKSIRREAPRIAKNELKIADTDGDSRGGGEGSSDLTADTRSISNSSSISFGSVTVHTHPVTLGDNPAVSTGLPVTLGWKAVNSKCFET
jgi:hypothetical protein